MATEQPHEAASDMSPQTRDMHRALSSLIEELEAVDWYQQRADACGLAPLDRAGFLISDGQGALSESGDRAGAPMLLASSAGISWDNHMVAVDPA